jgi:Raf kinase inhibitor-like YbhB/YbcL family protein
MRRLTTLGTLFGLTAAALVLAACGDRSGKTLRDPIFPPPATTVGSTIPVETTAPEPFGLIAPWVDGAAIPDRHICTGDGVAPALSWPNVPAGTVELAVAAVDLDADDAVIWLLYAIPPTQISLAENEVPVGAYLWTNGAGESAWAPPCPPPGETHRYQFTVYALNQQLEAADDADASEVIAIMNTTAIASSSVSGFASGGP